MKLHPKFTAKDIASLDIAGRIESLSTNKKLALAGATLGVAKTMMDDTQDSVASAGINTVAGAGLAVGGFHGVKYISEKLDKEASKEVVNQEQKKSNEFVKEKELIKAESESTRVAQQGEKNRKLTVNKLELEKIKVKHDEDIKIQKAQRKMSNWMTKGKVAGALGLGAFALATVMDTSESMAEDKRASRMVEEQERNLTRKQTQEKRQLNKQSYGHVDFGEMAFELFNERTGHHKMGNAKFQ